MRAYCCISQYDFKFDDTKTTAESTYRDDGKSYIWTHDDKGNIILQAPFTDNPEIEEAETK